MAMCFACGAGSSGLVVERRERRVERGCEAQAERMAVWWGVGSHMMVGSARGLGEREGGREAVVEGLRAACKASFYVSRSDRHANTWRGGLRSACGVERPTLMPGGKHKPQTSVQ